MSSIYKALVNEKSSKKAGDKGSGPSPNRQKVLLLTSRGVTYRHRHLLNDLHALLPHTRKESKLDTKSKLYQLNELAELYNCNNVLFFEARKGQDLYIWMSKAPNGPTVKFHLHNLHTMDELRFTGNCLKGSRPILSFDGAFESSSHLRVLKELFTQIYGVPPQCRKMKPFIDHVMSFTVLDGKIWIRCYQLSESADEVAGGNENDNNDNEGSKGKARRKVTDEDLPMNLTEIGPRFVLTPIVILESSFGGPVIYENKEFVSPNQIRSELRRKRSSKFQVRAEAGMSLKTKRDTLGLTTDVTGKVSAADPLHKKKLFMAGV